MQISNIIKWLKLLFEQPSWMFPYIKERLGLGRMDDEKYVKLIYKRRNGVDLDLENPKLYTEKLNWMKLHDRRSEYTTMVDKYGVKELVSKLIGNEYVIPILGVWDRFDEIDFGKLPDRFVLKVTHDSGGCYYAGIRMLLT